MGKKEDLTLLKQLAERLNINDSFRDIGFAVATDKQPAQVRSFNNSIEATLYSSGDVTVQASRAPRIDIRLVDHNNSRFCLAPKEAIYEITVCKPTENGTLESLNGDIATVYVDNSGLVLNSAARSRAAKLYEKDSRNR